MMMPYKVSEDCEEAFAAYFPNWNLHPNVFHDIETLKPIEGRSPYITRGDGMVSFISDGRVVVCGLHRIVDRHGESFLAHLVKQTSGDTAVMAAYEMSRWLKDLEAIVNGR